MQNINKSLIVHFSQYETAENKPVQDVHMYTERHVMQY